jgi:hypothetical protein
MMFPWKTGMHAPSYSSNALCVRRMEDGPRIQPTDTARMTFRTTWYSSAPLRLTLPIKGPMEDAGVIKLYEPSPTLCLYVAMAENIVGRAPLIPLFLAGNSTPTISHVQQAQGFGLSVWLR